MFWLVIVGAVLGLSGAIGAHLSRFRDTGTEMTGMMAGMTMGLLNGFVLGYAAAALTNTMVWGNLFGILLGLTLGSYFGRAGGLMGLMDGAMGGIMGGAMGAMLEIMVRYPEEGLVWTAVLLGAIYLAGMIGLVVLIEQGAPEQAHLHRLAPLFNRARRADGASAPAGGGPGLINYYEMLNIPVQATITQVATAYAAFVADTDEAGRTVADQALAALTAPERRARYDHELAVAAGRGECGPPPRRASVAAGRRTTPAVGATRPRTQEKVAHGQR